MDAKEEIEGLYGSLIKLRYIRAAGTVGCSEKQVAELDAYAAGGRLPELYRQFLLRMGERITGTYLSSYYYSYEYLPKIQKEARQMAERNKVDVPTDAFFFATFDYVDFFYFRTHEPNDNPPIYMYGSSRPPLLLHKSLRGFLGEEMGEEEK